MVPMFVEGAATIYGMLRRWRGLAFVWLFLRILVFHFRSLQPTTT